VSRLNIIVVTVSVSDCVNLANKWMLGLANVYVGCTDSSWSVITDFEPEHMITYVHADYNRRACFSTL
jgi:hypothetical protein